MKLSTKIAYNTIVQIISKTAATVLGLIAVAVITRYLDPAGFGQYTTIITFLSFFGILADFGLTLVTVQMICRPGADEEKILGNLFALRLFSAIIFIGLAPMAVLLFPYSAEIKIGVAITSLSFLLIALNQILTGIFQKNLRMDKVSIAEVSSRILLVIGVIWAVRMDFGLYGVLVATVVGSLLNFLLHFVFSRQFVRFKLRFDPEIWKQIFTYSWPLAITIALNLLYLKTDILFLSFLDRPTEAGLMAEVGIYGAAYKVIDVLVTLPFMFAGIILPILTVRWAENEKSGFAAILQKAFDVMVIFAMPLIVGTQMVSGQVMTVVAGSEFAGSGPVLQILILAAAMIFFGNMFAHAIIAIGKQKKVIGAYVFTAVTAVIGYFIFIPRFSYFGAAWMTVYSEAVIALASAYYVWKYTRFLPNLTIFLKTGAASAIMAGGIYLLHSIDIHHLLLVLPAASIFYFVSLYFFRGLSKQDVQDLLNR